MNEARQRPLPLRILRSRVLWAIVFVLIVLGILGWSQALLSAKVTDTQAQFVADSVRRSAVQCYAIEGRFPDSAEGVAYLESNYGLTVDHKRYVVYYESMGDNLIPQIRVLAVAPSSPTDDIARFLGIGKGR